MSALLSTTRSAWSFILGINYGSLNLSLSGACVSIVCETTHCSDPRTTKREGETYAIFYDLDGFASLPLEVGDLAVHEQEEIDSEYHPTMFPLRIQVSCLWEQWTPRWSSWKWDDAIGRVYLYYAYLNGTWLIHASIVVMLKLCFGWPLGWGFYAQGSLSLVGIALFVKRNRASAVLLIHQEPVITNVWWYIHRANLQDLATGPDISRLPSIPSKSRIQVSSDWKSATNRLGRAWSVFGNSPT
jgi:hypothetical protein